MVVVPVCLCVGVWFRMEGRGAVAVRLWLFLLFKLTFSCPSLMMCFVSSIIWGPEFYS